MSGKAGPSTIPKGYTDKKSQDIHQEWAKTVAQLGQERAAELRSQRNQLKLEDAIEKLEVEFQVASEREQRKAKDQPAQEAPPSEPTPAT